MTDKAQFEVTTAREIAGAWRKQGEVLNLRPGQAKYYLPPYGTGLKPVAAKAPAKADKAPAKAD